MMEENEVKGNVDLVINTDENEIFTTIKIFGWDLWRVFRTEDKEIIKIVLHKGNEFKEFVNTDWRKKVDMEGRMDESNDELRELKIDGMKENMMDIFDRMGKKK